MINDETMSNNLNRIDKLILTLTEGEWGINKNGKNSIRKLLLEFDVDLIYSSTIIAFEYYKDPDIAFDKIGGICFNTLRDRKVQG